MRGIAAVIIGLALAACSSAHDNLWPGPDWRAAGPAAGSVAAGSDASDAAPMNDDGTGTRVPRYRTTRGSSTTPDLLQNPSDQRRPPRVVQPSAPPPQIVEPRNDVIAPRDPNRPYSADGFGYQRQGTTIVGPQGETYNRVGSSIIGPGGRACTAVGNSIVC